MRIPKLLSKQSRKQGVLILRIEIDDILSCERELLCLEPWI